MKEVYWITSVVTASSATGLASGTYTVTVTDANGCTLSNTVTVPATSPILTIATIVTPASCAASNATAIATPSGGTLNYTYNWLPSGGTGYTATGLAPGTYTVIVTDANGCTKTNTAIVI